MAKFCDIRMKTNMDTSLILRFNRRILSLFTFSTTLAYSNNRDILFEEAADKTTVDQIHLNMYGLVDV